MGGHAGITLLTTVAEPQSSVPLRPSSHATSRCTGIYSYREHQRSKLATDLTVGTAKELVSITTPFPSNRLTSPVASKTEPSCVESPGNSDTQTRRKKSRKNKFNSLSCVFRRHTLVDFELNSKNTPLSPFVFIGLEEEVGDEGSFGATLKIKHLHYLWAGCPILIVNYIINFLAFKSPIAGGSTPISLH